MSYRLIRSTDHNSLSSSVRKAIEDGYEPYREVVAVHLGGYMVEYIQAVVRKTKKNIKPKTQQPTSAVGH